MTAGRPTGPNHCIAAPEPGGPAIPPAPHISANAALQATSIWPRKREPSSTRAIDRRHADGFVEHENVAQRTFAIRLQLDALAA